MIWNLILILVFLYLAVVLRGQILFLKQMESRLDVRITSLETQTQDLRDCIQRIEDKLQVSQESSRGAVPYEHLEDLSLRRTQSSH